MIKALKRLKPQANTIAFINALYFINLYGNNIIMPMMSVSPNGDIQMKWMNYAYRITVSFHSNDTYSYSALLNSTEYKTDNTSIDTKFPTEILTAIQLT